jgi:hypothetical protein
VVPGHEDNGQVRIGGMQLLLQRAFIRKSLNPNTG